MMYPNPIFGCEDVEPYGFASLMDLYENNFIRFKKLAPDLSGLDENSVSHVAGCLGLHLSVLERSRFTTTLLLTYHFDEAGETVPEPNLKLRIYHDAGLVEVLGGHLKHGRVKLDHPPADARRQKWRLNRFLYRWLAYCLYQGHHFPAVVSRRIRAVDITGLTV
jgi:uncharacterized protein